MSESFAVDRPTETTAKRIANALEGSFANFGGKVIEKADGTNTTDLFYDYLTSVLAAGETDRYAILSAFADALAGAWHGKTYTLRSYNAAVSGVTTMTPMDDLAGKTAAQLCTDSTTPVEDWADEDPMTWYIRANALSLADGTMNIIAFEGEAGFDLSGETAPVYTFSLALWIKEWDDGTYDYISFRTTRTGGFYPFAGDVAPDGTKRSITWHPTFPGGLNGDGKLTSGANIKPYNFAAASTGNTKAKLWDAYEGLWNDCDTKWLLRMWQLRHFDLENSNILEGCLNYSLQHQVAEAENGVKRVLLTTANASGYVVGSCVSIGDPGESTNYDRGQAHVRNIADLVKISSIETVTVNGTEYKAINLELDETINVTATTRISTMPWYSGSTEGVPGHKDGSLYNLTNGKTPCRIAGVEILDGSYAIGLDPLYQVTAGSDATHWNYKVYECRDSEKLASSVTSDYVDTGIEMLDVAQGWNWVKAFFVTMLGILFPKLFGSSSTTYMKSAFYGTYSAGVRCPWRFGTLGNGGLGGLACELGYVSPGDSSWVGRPRLCGSGKKRGEWVA